jgi:5-methyltetrahydrofolate--homocysteine methyltransferase
LSPTDLRATLSRRVVIADGAMGTMLQRHDLTLEDFQQLEGCNEILNLTRPDIVEQSTTRTSRSGVDAVETNTFGANLSALGGMASPTGSQVAQAGLGSHVSRPTRTAPRIGSDGCSAASVPAPDCRPSGISYARLRDAYQRQVEGA